MQLSFKLIKSTDFIFDYLTDMQKFVSVHPIIYQIDKREDGTYLVHEKLKLGFIPFSFTYPVTIEKDSLKKNVIIRATVFKLTKIEMNFTLSSQNDYTVINESILIKSPLPIKAIMRNIFRKQHTELFKNIDATGK